MSIIRPLQNRPNDQNLNNDIRNDPLKSQKCSLPEYTLHRGARRRPPGQGRKRKETALGGANLSAGRIGSTHQERSSLLLLEAGGKFPVIDNPPSEPLEAERAILYPLGNGGVNSHRTDKGAMSATLRYKLWNGYSVGRRTQCKRAELFGWLSSGAMGK